MKAMVMHRYGGPEQLESADHPAPVRGPGEVLIRLKTTSVNPVDWKVGAGHLDAAIPGDFPIIPGWDAAGQVAEADPADTGFTVGDEVFGYLRRPVVKWGTYAQYTVAEPSMIAAKPPTLEWDAAGALPLVGLTALQALDAVGVGTGDTVLVHAAAGGVGSIAVQVALARGAQVIGTASQGHHDHVRTLGAEPVEYGDGLEDRIEAFAPDGIDAALDAAGGQFELSVRAGAEPSRVVSIIDRSVRDDGGRWVFVEPDADGLRALAALTESGQVDVPVSAVYRLDQAAEAWRASRSGHTRGKLVIRVD
ncbi:NADP-dependent oxidoreductase [Glycomyces xiaoerkulensis]|uniref:NADP-dependent oxidoreductase n=1 Tax=Glycomyces xiaoerkulensis TaxID=2038139 RepID=UPI000C264C22|nr:NADP-dependent oxidoreductase [Glycomyces xiaoerkulensis]